MKAKNLPPLQAFAFWEVENPTWSFLSLTGRR